MRAVRHAGPGPVLELDGLSLGVEDVVDVARHRRRVAIAPAAERRIDRSRVMVDWLLSRREKVYGLTTGFGKLRDVPIPPEHTAALQVNLIRSHAAGMGEPLPEDVVRAAILLRANTLCRGNSGIRRSVVQALLDLLNADVYPHVPALGSVGCSGDLAPLSHLVLVLIGDPEGKVYRRGTGGGVVSDARSSDFEALGEAGLDAWGLTPVQLGAKEGLALNNGTQVMTAIGLLVAYDAHWTLRIAEMAGACSLEANRGVRGAYRDEIHEARPQRHQRDVARRVIAYCEESQILDLYLNSAAFRRAGRHLDEAREALQDLKEQLLAACWEVPGPVGQLDRELRKVRSAYDAVLPSGPDAEAQVAAWAARLPREQIAIFEGRLRPLRQRLNALLETLHQPTFPAEDATRRLDEALLSAQVRLREAVPAAPLVQDDYSFRCFPQVLACAWRAWEHVLEILETEANAATDNPLLFPPVPEGVDPVAFDSWTGEAYLASLQADGRAPGSPLLQRCRMGVVGGGNFHGEPVAVAMDYLSIALAEAANISERRTAHLVDESLSRGLPPFLVDGSGLNSGLMIPQYTAAALVSENKILCHPASVDSIPTCANSEDHVSMGTIAARKCATILKNVQRVIAIELYSAHQGLQFRAPLLPGRPIRRLRAWLDAQGLAPFADDIVLGPRLEHVAALFGNGLEQWLVEGGDPPSTT